MSSSVRGRGTTDKPHTVEKLECGELRIVVCRGTLTQTLALGRAYPWVCLRFRVLTLACAYACVCVRPYPQWLVLSLCLVCWMPPRGGGGGGLGGRGGHAWLQHSGSEDLGQMVGAVFQGLDRAPRPRPSDVSCLRLPTQQCQCILDDIFLN